jgi:hypothetical protein
MYSGPYPADTSVLERIHVNRDPTGRAFVCVVPTKGPGVRITLERNLDRPNLGAAREELRPGIPDLMAQDPTGAAVSGSSRP